MKKLIHILIILLLVSACAQKSGDDDSSTSSSEVSSDSDTSSDSGGVISVNTDDSNSSDDPSIDTNQGNIIRITTFNVGLLPAFVPQTDERLTPIATRLASDNSDVLCLQEMWRASDRSAIEQQLALRFPFKMRAEARQKLSSQSPACSISSFEPIAQCLISSCSFAQDDILACATTNCREAIFTLAADDPQCAAALFAQSGRSSSEILDIQDELLSDSRQAGIFAFGGESGIEIFSKLPLEDQVIIDFFDDSTTSRRVALLATVRRGTKSIRVACTHLSSNLDGILPYTGAHTSWEGENLIQANILLSQTQSTGTDGVVLSGDFNCSESNPNTGALSDFAGTCQNIRASGFQDFAAESLRCSYCNENILNQLKTGQGEQVDLVLDHVFAKGLQAVSSATLLYNETITIDNSASNLSDHYGVSMLFRTQ